MSFFEETNPEMDRYLETHASSEPEKGNFPENNAASYDFGISARKIAHYYISNDAA